MSFGRLLAAGKSWVGGDGIGRYRMQKHIRLPKFISPQNPFKSETPVPPADIPAMTSVGCVVATPVNQFSRRARLGTGLRRFALFCLDHDPFSLIGRAKLPGVPRFGKAGVQGELSLDKVTVVRGDLAHADLEVAQVETGRFRAASPAWKNLTARVFGAALK